MKRRFRDQVYEEGTGGCDRCSARVTVTRERPEAAVKPWFAWLSFLLFPVDTAAAYLMERHPWRCRSCGARVSDVDRRPTS